MKANLHRIGLLLLSVIALAILILPGCRKKVLFQSEKESTPKSTSPIENLRQFEELIVDIPALLLKVRTHSLGMLELRLNRTSGSPYTFYVKVKHPEPDAELFVDDVPQPMPEIYTLVGYRKEADEPCVITLAEGWFSAVFKVNGEELFIQARRDFDPAAAEDQFVIYCANDVINLGPVPTCSFDHDPASSSRQKEENNLAMATCKKVNMTVVADPEFRARYSSSANCLEAMTTQINNASYCYWNNSNLLLDLTVSKSYIYSSTSSFTSTNDDDLLDQLRIWGNASDRRSKLNFLFTGKDLDGAVAGTAYLGVACSDPSQSYALGMNQPTTVFWRNLIAHEIGHNFNAPHHTSGIMQSMITTSNTFSASSKSVILTFTNENNCYPTSGTCN